MTAALSDPARSQREANVAVVVNASDQAHFSFTGEAPFEAARPEWARLTFLADHDIADLGDAARARRGRRGGVRLQRVQHRRRPPGDPRRLRPPVGHRRPRARRGRARPAPVPDRRHRPVAGLPRRRRRARSWPTSRSTSRPTPFAPTPPGSSPSRSIAALSKGYGQSEHVSWTRVEAALPGPVAEAGVAARGRAADRRVRDARAHGDLQPDPARLHGQLGAAARR